MFERCLYFNVNTLARKVNRLWKEAFEAVGLSPSHAYLLQLVVAEPGLSQQAIANTLILEKSTVTRFINKMEGEGFIERRIPETRHTREQVIFPTEKATRLQNKLNDIGDGLYASMLQTIGDNQVKELVKDLREAGDRL